jgi:hypothetical protein
MDLFNLIHLSISASTLIALITSIFKLGRWVERMELEVESLKNNHKEFREIQDVQGTRIAEIRTAIEVIRERQGHSANANS